MAFNATTRGELLLLSQSLLWSLFPIITILSNASLPPLYSGSIAILLSTFCFAVLLTIRKSWSDILVKAAWKDVAIAVSLQSFVFYALVFTAIRYSTAGNIAIIGLMEVFFTYVLLGIILRRESFTRLHVYGALCMVSGVLIVLVPNVSNLHIGDFLMLIATMIAPLGNSYAKRARTKISSECVMFFRASIGGSALFLAAVLFEPMPSTEQLTSALAFLCINGFVLVGFRVWMWLEAIHYIALPKAISLTSITPIFTLLFAYVILHESISVTQIVAILPTIVGVYLLTWHDRRNSTPIVHPVV